MTHPTVDDAFFGEQFPLSPLDDYLIHQTPDPVRVMWTGDPRAYERYWMVCHDPAGEVLVAVGGSFYPNLDRAEAYAIVVTGGRHVAVRAFRPLGVDRADLRVGPMNPQIVRGLRQWRYVLEDNEQGVTFDLDFVDTTRQVFRDPLSTVARGTPAGRRNDVTSGFEGFGVVQGWVEVDGHRVELPPGSPGTRDRHWGTGRGVGGPAMALGDRIHVGTNGNAFVAFKDWTLWGDRVFYPLGDPRPGHGRVRKPTRRLRFEEGTHLFVEAEVDYPLGDGGTTTVHYTRLGQQTAFLRCGMYGGTPEGGPHPGGIHQGGWDGPPRTEGETYDLTDPFVRTRLSGLDEHLCRVECDGETTTGIYQAIDPTAYELCAAGKPGWSFL